MKSAQALYSLMDTANENTIFTPFQLARNFNKTVYNACPWFLEYVEGKFPSDEELQHNNAVKEREDRVAREAKKQTTLLEMETSIEQQDKVSQASSSLVNFIPLPLCKCSL